MVQTLADIEIICIDDCSPDGSAAIVEKLTCEDNRIRLIRHKQNLGLGGARNTGIAAARAPYLAGVDSDDYIMPTMLEQLWAAAANQTADVVACGIAMLDENGTLLHNICKPEQKLENDRSQINILDVLPPSFCNKLWRTSLFRAHGITFPKHLYYEDLATTPRLLRFAKDIRIISTALYCYVVRRNSITNSMSPRHIIDYFRTYDVLYDFLEAEDLLDRYYGDLVVKIGKSLHYHAQTVVDADRDEAELAQYVRHLLMLKLAYLEYNDKLRALDLGALKDLLLNATSPSDVHDPTRK